MMDKWESEDGRVRLYCADCRDVLPVECDCVIADPPFSDRTHAGHDALARGHAGEGHDGANRGVIGYAAWTPSDVAEAVGLSPARGWYCVLTDHVLAREWEARLLACGRYVFAPIPCVVRGRSVRLSGDGPSSWTDWLIVSRTAAESRWGTLPGVYEGRSGEIIHKGGKPTGLMACIVRDYSETNDTVLDFCMGSGTTGIACIRTGRRFIGIEKDPHYFDIARARIERELRQARLGLEFGVERQEVLAADMMAGVA
jgi:site-specific DNA-methyltransferase (adenine-specific)